MTLEISQHADGTLSCFVDWAFGMAYTGSGRVNVAKKPSDIPVYTALSHMIIFVQPGDESNVTYLVDVGCGGSGPTRPILLSASEDNIVMGTSPTEKHRLTRGAHPESRLAAATPDWHLEVLHIKEGTDASQSEWKLVYAFDEKEYFPTDYASANLAVCRQQGGYFGDNVVASKHFWLDKDDQGPIETRHAGRFGMEGAVIRKHTGNQTEIVRTVATESERARALQEFFGVRIDPNALKYICGRTAAL
ncbi:hypothetical protein H0H92_004801 [Tricholoma furcatifolium]|nr:hypothetical protein H0H92_004801 [Tricholoma furcatifolium]